MISPQQALNKMAKMCSKKEYCCQDVRKKLCDWEITGEDAEKIIQFLIAQKFIDEQRFARFYASDKFRFNKWGKIKIAEMLRQKGIGADVIREAIQHIEGEDYLDSCKQLLLRKINSIRQDNPVKAKAALIRFALGRGFDYETIRTVIDEIKRS